MRRAPSTRTGPKITGLAWGLAAVAVIGAASGQSTPDQGGRLSYSERQPLLGFEPVIRTNVATTRFCSMIFEQLLDRKRLGIGVECRLCESYTATDRIVTFQLKKGVAWHDRMPLTAQDVAFSYRAVTNPETGSALKTELDVIDDVTVLDPYTVSFSFKQPVAKAEAYFMALPILPAHKFSAFSPSLEEEPDIGRVRDLRVHNVFLYAEPKADARQVVQLPIGAQLTVIESNPGWARVKVIGKGPAGKEGWLERHVPVIGTKTSADFLVSPVGTGPYKFVAATLNGDATLQRFPNYHGEAPHVEHVRRARSSDTQTMVTRLTSEIIDLIPDTPLESLARITASGVAKTIPYPSLNFVGLMYNARHPLLSKKPFRQALTHATNREQWLETFYQGQGSLIGGPASPDSWLYDSRVQPLAYDMRKAKELLASVTKDKNISLNLIVSNDRPPQDYDMLQAYVHALRDLGVSVKVVVMERGVYEETLRRGDFEIALVDYLLSYGYNFRPLFEPGGVQNHGNYRNEELGALFDAWRKETDFEKIRELAFRSQLLLAEEAPYTFLWSLKNICAVNNKVRRISPETIDPYRFFAWVHLWWIPEIYH
jgi:ABC-type transport system substrate-binding protein